MTASREVTERKNKGGREREREIKNERQLT